MTQSAYGLAFGQQLSVGADFGLRMLDFGSAKLIDATDNVGVCNGCIDAVLSDTVDLVHPGYIQPRLLAGNIKFTDVNGNVSTLAFDQKEISPFRVKRVWSTGTTAAMGIVVLY